MRENAEPINIKDTDFRKMMEPYYAEALKTLKELVSIDSVLDPTTATETMPFGQGVENALSYVAELGKKMGFKVSRCDNYVTELTYGEGDKIFDIYGHCDVVPVQKEKWNYNPFDVTIVDDNIMYGRGTSDDKGPALSCLYAVKALMDKGLLGGYKLRFLFGGNEETGSLCLDHYFHHMNKEFPTFGISPDADYPLIYAEKSIYSYNQEFDIDLDGVEDFEEGNALNIVLADCSCRFNRDVKKELAKYLEKHPETKAEYENGVLSFHGKPYHGSMPWNGVNAGLYLLDFLSEILNKKKLHHIFECYKDGMGTAFDGNYRDEVFSETSYNVGKVSYKNGKLTLSINLRFPGSMNVNNILKTVEDKVGGKVTLLGGSDGFVSDPNSDFIRILMHSYQEETGDYESKPLSIGGGTYARESKNSVAFGAQFVGRDYRMHGHDEFFPLSDFYDNMQIYARAILEISEYLRTGKLPF